MCQWFSGFYNHQLKRQEIKKLRQARKFSKISISSMIVPKISTKGTSIDLTYDSSFLSFRITVLFCIQTIFTTNFTIILCSCNVQSNLAIVGVLIKYFSMPCNLLNEIELNFILSTLIQLKILDIPRYSKFVEECFKSAYKLQLKFNHLLADKFFS